MSHIKPLIRDEYYHVYNRGNNRKNIFIEERNYRTSSTCMRTTLSALLPPTLTACCEITSICWCGSVFRTASPEV